MSRKRRYFNIQLTEVGVGLTYRLTVFINGDEVRQAGLAERLVLKPHKHDISVWQPCHLHTQKTRRFNAGVVPVCVNRNTALCIFGEFAQEAENGVVVRCLM